MNWGVREVNRQKLLNLCIRRRHLDLGAALDELLVRVGEQLDPLHIVGVVDGIEMRMVVMLKHHRVE